METLHKKVNQALDWVPVDFFRRVFELRGEHQVFATLKWSKHFGLLASAVTADGEWKFNRSGFLHPKVYARKPDSKEDVAVLIPNLAGTVTVEINTGLKVSWENKNTLRSVWAFVDQNQGDILDFQTPRLKELKVRVGLFKDLPESPLLACLGLYLLVLTHEESAAETAALVPVMDSI